MRMRRFTAEQRQAICRAAQDARRTRKLGPGYDAVDLACETGNFWWTGLDDRQARAALRLIHIAAAG